MREAILQANWRETRANNDSLMTSGSSSRTAPNFTQFDPKSADFDLMIHAAEEIDVSGWQKSRDITRPIHSAAR